MSKAIVKDGELLPLRMIKSIDVTQLETAQDIIQAITEMFVAVYSNSNQGSVVSVEEPGEEDRDKIWYKRGASGASLGTYIFVEDDWVPYPTNSQTVWVIDETGKIPKGYKIIDSARTDISEATRNHIINMYKRDPTDSFYVYFAVTALNF